MSDDSHEYDEDALEFIEDERVRIAALHATCPKQIWLQVDPEAEQFDGWDAQTWCSDKINETDVRYVLATSRDAEVAKAFEAGRVAEREECAKVCDNNYWSEEIDWWLRATKKDVSAKAARKCAAAIRASGDTK